MSESKNSPAPALSSEQDPSLHKHVPADYAKLVAAAATLNSVSDEIAAPIASIDTALKRLNLGISAWVKIAGSEDPDGMTSWYRSIGYNKVSSGKWGIAICFVVIDDARGVLEQHDEWLFNDAPRAYRLEALDKLPELLRELTARANGTTDALRKKLAATKQVAAAIESVAASGSAGGR